MRSTGLGWPAEDVRPDGGTTLRSGLGWPSDDDAEHAPAAFPEDTSRPAADVSRETVTAAPAPSAADVSRETADTRGTDVSRERAGRLLEAPMSEMLRATPRVPAEPELPPLDDLPDPPSVPPAISPLTTAGTPTAKELAVTEPAAPESAAEPTTPGVDDTPIARAA